MFIKQFKIENFRSIQKLELNFNKGVNIIIGENNAGKTAIIDALRICLSYGSMYRDIYINKNEDFFTKVEIDEITGSPIIKKSNEIRFDLIFEKESDIEGAVFTDFIRQDPENKDLQTIEMHFKFYLEQRSHNEILRWNIWGGEHEGQPLPVEALQLISHTYLDALRDAEEKLRPNSRGNKIANLFKNLKSYGEDTKELDKQKKQELAKAIQNVIENGEWKELINTGNQKVSEHIKHSAINGKEPSVEFSFMPYTYEGVVSNIEARKPLLEEINGTQTQEYFRITQNGLGENNLIYAGTVLGDLIAQNDAEEKEYFYNALLIEEPEAHLHPQKQNTFFQYLTSLKNKGIQIFITSHSPTITAKSNLDFITILQRRGSQISSFSLANSELSTDNKTYLSKFLDVTKSQLFFANGVLLVEGISEALLMPIFSRIIGQDLERNGVEIVNLNGVAFEHFAKLFNSTDDSKNLLARCSLLTDDDRGQIEKIDFKQIESTKQSNIFRELKLQEVIDPLNRVRKTDESSIDFEVIDELVKEEKAIILETLEELKDKFSPRASLAKEFERSNLKSFLAEITFEYELMIASKFNMRLLKWVYQKMHPRTKLLSSSEPIADQAYHILKKLYSNKDKCKQSVSPVFHLCF